MFQILKRELNISIITSIVYVILGIIIISHPEATLTIVSTAIAILLMIYGLILSIVSIKNLKEENTLVFGVLSVVLGLALLIYPDSLGVLISLGIGIWFISNSITRLKFAILLR